MKKKTIVTLDQGGWFRAVFVPLPCSLLCLALGQIILSIVVYLITLFIYRLFFFKVIRINKNSVIGFHCSKPFRKTYKYVNVDIVQVYISMNGKRGWHVEFLFRDHIRFSIYEKDNIQVLCRHFVNHKVPIQTDNSYLRNVITEYLATLQIDPQKQIASRKAREAIRKTRLKKRRGI